MAEFQPPNPARAKTPKPFVHQHGVGHQTPAHRQILSLALGGTKATRGRKKKAAAGATQTRRRKRKSRTTKSAHTAKGKAHLVRGSSAAKAHMAKLRKMRKKAA